MTMLPRFLQLHPTRRTLPAAVLSAAVLLLLAMTSPARAQEPEADVTITGSDMAYDQESGQLQVIAVKDVVVKYVRPAQHAANTLTDALQSVHHRQFLVRNDDGSVAGPYWNIDRFGDLIVLHDTPQQVEVLTQSMSALQQALAGGGPASAGVALQVKEYVPRHQQVSNLLRALEPFRRFVVNDSATGADGGGVTGGVQTHNVASLQEPALIVLRDTEENLAAMLALLERVDVPAPQMLLTCTLLRAVQEGDPSPPVDGLSPELAAGLRALVPYEHFRTVGFAALRASVVGGRELSVLGQYENGEQFKLVMQPIGFDAKTGVLSLDRCKFTAADGQQFEAGMTLRAGEDTVLGASGADPLFVVLRILPLDG
jgi:hypothetical protein